MTGYEVNGYATPLHPACELNIIIVSLILQVGNYVLRALETLPWLHSSGHEALTPPPFSFPCPPFLCCLTPLTTWGSGMRLAPT